MKMRELLTILFEKFVEVQSKKGKTNLNDVCKSLIIEGIKEMGGWQYFVFILLFRMI